MACLGADQSFDGGSSGGERCLEAGGQGFNGLTMSQSSISDGIIKTSDDG